MKHIYPEPSSNFSSFKMLCAAFIEKLKLCSSISQVCADDGCSHGPNILLPFINVVFIVALCLLLTVPHIFLLISVFSLQYEFPFISGSSVCAPHMLSEQRQLLSALYPPVSARHCY